MIVAILKTVIADEAALKAIFEICVSKSAVFVIVCRYHVDLLPQSKIEKKHGNWIFGTVSNAKRPQVTPNVPG